VNHLDVHLLQASVHMLITIGAVDRASLKNSMDLSQQPTLAGFLHRLKRQAFSFRTVVDVGASNGMWSMELLPLFPGLEYFLIEAQPGHEPALQAFVAENPGSRYIIAAAADRPGTLHFHAGDLFGGLASHRPFAEHDVQVPAITLDGAMQDHQLNGPFLLKLDTHGFELEILSGAERLLARTEVAVIEVYNHDMAFGNRRFPEMCLEMERRGFRCIDCFDLLYRPHDGSFWQMDLAFARQDWPGFKYPHYL
jgi:FkbM family methyltransferase